MDVTLLDLQAEIHNVAFLFAAYTVGWVIVLCYVFWLSRRAQGLRAEIEELKQSLQSDSPKRQP